MPLSQDATFRVKYVLFVARYVVLHMLFVYLSAGFAEQPGWRATLQAGGGAES